MKPDLKIVPRAKSTAKAERTRRVWTNEQLWDVLGQTLHPINWELKDALTLIVWRHLTANRPWDTGRAERAESIADDIIDELEARR